MEKSFNKSANLKIKVQCFFILFINDIIFLAPGSFLASYLKFQAYFFGINKQAYGISERYIYYSLIFILITLITLALLKIYNWNSI